MNIGFHEKNLYLSIDRHPVFLIYKLRTVKFAILTWITTKDAV